MEININDLYLIIAQLRVDMNRYEEQHEQLIRFYGGGEDVRQEVYDNHLGRYMKELGRIIGLLEMEALRQEEEKDQNEVRNAEGQVGNG